MEYLKQLIEQEGVSDKDALKASTFLNHRLEVGLLRAIGQEIGRRFAAVPVTQILTVESSGIGIAVAAAMAMGDIPVIFARRSDRSVFGVDCYKGEAKSSTRKEEYSMYVEKRLIGKDDVVLVVDDFLARGEAVEGLTDIVRQASAAVAGVCVVIEKEWLGGGKSLRTQGVKVESLVKISAIKNGKIMYGKE